MKITKKDLKKIIAEELEKELRACAEEASQGLEEGFFDFFSGKKECFKPMEFTFDRPKYATSFIKDVENVWHGLRSVERPHEEIEYREKAMALSYVIRMEIDETDKRTVRICGKEPWYENWRTHGTISRLVNKWMNPQYKDFGKWKEKTVQPMSLATEELEKLL